MFMPLFLKCCLNLTTNHSLASVNIPDIHNPCATVVLYKTSVSGSGKVRLYCSAGLTCVCKVR